MIAALAIAVQAAPASPPDIRGQWINERRTAIVSIADCDSGLCGTMTWSAPEARRDAARGGTARLDGVTVMYGFVPSSAGGWRGRLFLPDQNRTVGARIRLTGPNELRVKGCELAGLICRSQTWRRHLAG